jgi:heme exporter protein A
VQNLMLLARVLGIENAREAVIGLLEHVGLTRRANHPVRQFSAGMRKRVAIARLLLKAPDVVLLDEPFGELDPAGIAQMERLVQELKEGGATIVLATHLVEQGMALCNRRLHLADGRAVAT